jgi:hypothetical protein
VIMAQPAHPDKPQATWPTLSSEAYRDIHTGQDIVDVVRRYLWYPSLAG